VLWKLCRGQILAPVGASSSSSAGTSASVASSAPVAAVSASAVATAVASALGLVVVPPAWRFRTVAVAVPVASPVGMSASAPSSTGGCSGGLAFYFGFKGYFLLAFGGSSFSGAILGAFGARGLGDLFCGGVGSWFVLVLSSGGFAGNRDGESLHEIVQFKVGSTLGVSEMTSFSCNSGGN